MSAKSLAEASLAKCRKAYLHSFGWRPVIRRGSVWQYTRKHTEDYVRAHVIKDMHNGDAFAEEPPTMADTVLGLVAL